MSEIRKFYSGQNVLITGGTGFLGKILLEKLLRSTEVATVFLLIRNKKDKNANTRLDNMFDNVIFQKLKLERPKFRHQVVAIPGDCSIEGLGLSPSDRQKLTSQVNIIFHVAATVRLTENLKLSYTINVNGTGDILELCKQTKNLKTLIHVSTAYSNSHLHSIGETFYDYPVDYEKLGETFEKLSEMEVEKMTPEVIGTWPNTYTFTKALAEAVIRDRAGNLPVGVFRPAIVISTYKEPVECWVDNLYGPIGVAAGALSGLLRVVPCNNDAVADIVPADTCVAGIIASAWDVANKATERKAPNVPIYNYVSSVENPITWGEYNALSKLHGVNYPLQKAAWTIKSVFIKNRNLYLILRILVHLIPATFVDTFAVMAAQKPTLLSTYKKLHKFSDAITKFSTTEWKFTNDNVRNLWEKMHQTDRILFPFSMATVHWTIYFRSYFKGIRVYLMNDPMSTLEKARARKKKFDIAHRFIELLFVFLTVTLFVRSGIFDFPYFFAANWNDYVVNYSISV